MYYACCTFSCVYTFYDTAFHELLRMWFKIIFNKPQYKPYHLSISFGNSFSWNAHTPEHSLTVNMQSNNCFIHVPQIRLKCRRLQHQIIINKQTQISVRVQKKNQILSFRVSTYRVSVKKNSYDQFSFSMYAKLSFLFLWFASRNMEIKETTVKFPHGILSDKFGPYVSIQI